MIPIGTPCWLTRSGRYNTRIVEVSGPLLERRTATHGIALCYVVTASFLPTPPVGKGWVAQPHQLIPMTPGGIALSLSGPTKARA